jgi:hypothetical protein
MKNLLLKDNGKNCADELRNYLAELDKRRSIKVTDYIPDLHKYMDEQNNV